MITLRRESTEVVVILHDPLEQVNGKQRAFGADGQERGAGGGCHENNWFRRFYLFGRHT